MPMPAKPTEQKRRTGNPGKRALPEPEVVVALTDSVPEPMSPLATQGRKLWDIVWARGATWLTESDAVIVQHLCELEDERYALRVEVVKDSDDWRRRAGLRALDSLILEAKRNLGFDPEGRRRLAIEARPDEADDLPSLDEFRKRRQEIIAAAGG